VTPRATHKLRPYRILVLLLFLSAVSAAGQDLPGKIRGYKLYKTHVRVVGPADKAPADSKRSASVKLGDIQAIEIGLFSATVNVGAEISASDQSGKVDFLMFRDFTINGVPVDIEEYRHPFTFTKNTAVVLPDPVRVSLSFANLPKAAYKELVESPKELPVRGTILVFGRFRKMGFEFKRVIPVPIDLKISNPFRA
jgi:hypothetical protein